MSASHPNAPSSRRRLLLALAMLAMLSLLAFLVLRSPDAEPPALAAVELAEQYHQAVLTAFGEVSDALAAQRQSDLRGAALYRALGGDT